MRSNRELFSLVDMSKAMQRKTYWRGWWWGFTWGTTIPFMLELARRLS